MRINVTVSGMASVKSALAKLGTELQRGQAMTAAINKVADKAQVEIRRAITERYVIKASDVRGSMSLRRATNKRGAGIEAAITIFGSPTRHGRSMNVVRFLAAVQAYGQAMKTRGAKGTKKQLAALEKQLGFAIKRGGGLKTIPGAFIGNKGRTVFMRTGRGRLPIKPVQVVGVSQMFNGRDIRDRVMTKISRDLAIEINRAVQMILSRMK